MTAAGGASSAGRLSRTLRGIGAVLAGFAVIVALSIGTDQVFHALDVYPPWGEPMQETWRNVLALSYRCVYAVLGCYLAARLAPLAPMAHALALGAVGLVLSTLGAIAMWGMGPNWYPVLLALSALPCAWVGGALHTRAPRGRRGEPTPR